jgi:hypothetical protein
MKYERLARSSRGLGKRYSLWLGDDHLLVVDSTGYSEEYTRYYFKDIQAITSCRTISGKVWNGILGAILAIFASCAVFIYSSDGDPSVLSLLAVFSTPFLVILLWNIFHGPTCRCLLRTPVGIGELPALNRVRSFKRTLGKLRPLITQLQGVISQREITELVQAAKNTPPVLRNAPPTSATRINDSSYRGGLHLAAFLFLLSDGGISYLQMLHNSKTFVSLATLFSMLFLALAVMALIKQKDYYVTGFVKSMMWCGIGTMIVGSFFSYAFMVFLNMETLKSGTAMQHELFSLYAGIQASEHPSFGIFLLGYAIIAAVISIAGLIAISMSHRKTERHRL